MWDFLVFHPHTPRSWTKHLSHYGKFPPRPRNIPRRMSLSPFACEDDETITSHAQPNACRHSRLDLPALVSFSWHLSPIAPSYDRCYRKCLNRNEQLRHYHTAGSSAPAGSTFQWIWRTAGKGANSINSDHRGGLDRDCQTTLWTR